MTAASPVAQARALLAAGRPADARAVVRRALAQSPADPDANNVLCAALLALGDGAGALQAIDRALLAAPDDPALLMNRGQALLAQGRREEATADYARAAALAPADPDAHVGLSYALYTDRRFCAAEDAARAGLSRFPSHPGLAANLGACLFHTGRAREAVALLRSAQASAPNDLRIAAAIAQFANYASGFAPEQVRGWHERFGALCAAGVTAPPGWPAPAPVNPDPDRPLRVGLVSADLRSHACAFFLEPLIAHLPAEGFEIIAYSASPAEDAVSDRLRGMCGGWRAVAALSDQALASLIRKDRIDIVIECSGLTAGHRLAALSLRPAPLAMTYFGYPNTTGLRQIDARLVDAVTDPPGAESHATERLLRIPACFLCYRPGADTPPVEPPPSTRRGFVTFGSLNAISKLDDGAVVAWSRLCRETPGSRLMLKHHGLREDRSRALIARRFADAGFPEPQSRLILEPPGEGAAESLPAYHRVDVALDTFPYNGTTTTCEALCMGAPVVTIEGDRCAARVSASVLRTMGLDELVASDVAGMIRIAADLASDAPRLAELRRTLRPRLLASPAGDGPAFGRRLGATLRAAWRDRLLRGR